METSGNDVFGIKGRFRDQSIITIDDLRNYFRLKDPDIVESTIRWRIFHLKENRILLPVKRGIYSLSQKQTFAPVPTKLIHRICDSLDHNYGGEFVHIQWTTEWLHQFMIQQPTNSIHVVEVEKDWTNSAFEVLQYHFKNVYNDPDSETVRTYLSANKESIVVKPLVSRSPVQMLKHDIKVATLEKILVDIFSDNHLFINYQGKELENIFKNAWETYSMNLSALMNYATRRNRNKALLKFIERLPNKQLIKLLRK